MDLLDSEARSESCRQTWWRSLSRRDLGRALGAVALAWLIMLGYDSVKRGRRPDEVVEYALTMLMVGKISFPALVLGSVGLLALVPRRWTGFMFAGLLLPVPLLPHLVLGTVEGPLGLIVLPLGMAFLFARALPLLILPALVKLLVSGPPWQRRRRSA